MLKYARICLNKLDKARLFWNGLSPWADGLKEYAGKLWIGLEVAGNGWKWLDLDGN